LPLRPGPFKFEPKDINRLITSVIPTGQVIWQDDFEGSVLLWRGSQISGGATAGGNVVRLSADLAPFMGSACARIQSGYGPEASKYIMYKYAAIGLYGNGRYGIELWWAAHPTNLDVFGVELKLDSRKHGYERLGQVRYLHATGKWEYYDGDGTFHDLPNMPPYVDIESNYDCRNYLKLVIDVLRKEYVFAFLHGTKIDLSGRPLFDGTPTNADNVQAIIFIGSPDGATGHAQVNVDNVTVTCNEP